MDLVGRAQEHRASLDSSEDTDSPTGNMPLNVFAATFGNEDSDGALSPEPHADGLSLSGIQTTPPYIPPATLPPGLLIGVGLEQEREALHHTSRLGLESPPRKESKWDLAPTPTLAPASLNGTMMTNPGDDEASPHMKVPQ